MPRAGRRKEELPRGVGLTSLSGSLEGLKWGLLSEKNPKPKLEWAV